MNRVRVIRILFLFTVLHFLGCSVSYRLVEFEVLEPASINFPDKVRQLLIMNRLPLTYIFLDSSGITKLSKEQLLIFDTLITNNIFRGLNDVLKQSPISSYQWPIWSSERQTDLLAANDVVLTKWEVSDLCNKYNTDAVISLESCILKMELDGFHFDEPVLSLVYMSILRTNWTIYLPEYPKPFHEYNLVDTLYYTAFKENANRQSPSVSDAVRDISYETGLNYGSHLTPVWVITDRNIFSGGNAHLRSGSRDTKKGDWNMAFNEWTYLSVSGDSTEMAKALYNMAIYYELEDNLDSASYLINQAASYDTLHLIKRYQKEIDERLQKQNTIIRQVER